jgi:hypothetical protein
MGRVIGGEVVIATTAILEYTASPDPDALIAMLPLCCLRGLVGDLRFRSLAPEFQACDECRLEHSEYYHIRP